MWDFRSQSSPKHSHCFGNYNPNSTGEYQVGSNGLHRHFWGSTIFIIEITILIMTAISLFYHLFVIVFCNYMENISTANKSTAHAVWLHIMSSQNKINSCMNLLIQKSAVIETCIWHHISLLYDLWMFMVQPGTKKENISHEEQEIKKSQSSSWMDTW